MHEETDFFAVMSAVASDTKRQNDGARGKVEYFSALELDNAGGVF
jgi:hypothetical protein